MLQSGKEYLLIVDVAESPESFAKIRKTDLPTFLMHFSGDPDVSSEGACPSDCVRYPAAVFKFRRNIPTWVSGADVSSDRYVDGVRLRIAFSGLNPAVIQTDNELGAGIAVYSGNHDDSLPAKLAGIDYDSYGFVNVNSEGTVSLVSSAWIICEWLHCPSPYVSATLSACNRTGWRLSMEYVP